MRLLVFSIVLFIYSAVYSQENILKIQLPKSKTPEEIQVISTEDKFLLAYKAGYVTPRSQPYNFYWVDKQGTVSEADYPELRGKLIAGITQDSVHSYFYYLDGDKKSIVVNAIRENRLTGEKKACDPLVIEGKLLGVTSDKNRLIVYSFEKKAYQLRITEKVNDAPANERLFNLSFDFSKFANSDIAFIPEGAVIGASQASARVKIFIRSPNILIIWDDPFEEYSPSPQNIYKTVLININTRTGELSNKMVPEMSKGNFRSFLLSKYLFRVVAWAGDFTLQMFDMEKGELLNSKTLLYDKKYKENFVFLREGRDNTISKEETLRQMMDVSHMCDPFVVAQEDPLSDQGFIVTWGTYYNGKGTFGPTALGVQGLIIMAG